jgi:hypothetical protein
MNPIELAFSIIGIIYILVCCTLDVLLIKNRSEKGKKEYWYISNQIFYKWLSPELYTENGNRYRKILLRIMLVGWPLILGLAIAYGITQQ